MLIWLLPQRLRIPAIIAAMIVIVGAFGGYMALWFCLPSLLFSNWGLK